MYVIRGSKFNVTDVLIGVLDEPETEIFLYRSFSCVKIINHPDRAEFNTPFPQRKINLKLSQSKNKTELKHAVNRNIFPD
jgi:hypothetical protein